MTEVASILRRQEAVPTAVSLQSTNSAQGASLAMGSGSGSGRAEALLLTGTAASVASVQRGGVRTEGEPAVAGTGSSDLSHVLTGLGPSAALGSVLHTQTHLAEDQLELGMMASGDVSADPESLRFQYPIEEPQVSKKKTALGVYREQDRFLPINNVSRVMRNAIPRTGKVSKDAKECMQECVSEFVSFITSEAADRCSQEKRKTLTGDDILFAMATLGFDNYIEPMKLYLQKIREYTKLEKVVPASRGREMASHNLSASPPAEHEAAATLDMQPMQTSPVTTPYTPM